MNRIIFDLDGTLWETSEAYIYSYRKTCKELNISKEEAGEEKSVLSFLGVKLEDVLKTILPSVKDRQRLGQMLLGNVIEYLIKNLETYSKDIFSLFSNLSKKFKVYIMSNCPRPLLDAFYKITDVRQFITDDNTIEQSDKTHAIRRFTDDYSKRAIFVGDAQTDYESIENHDVVRFVYASYGYKDCPRYDYYLKNLDDVPSVITSAVTMDAILKNDIYQVISNKDSRITLIEKKDSYYFGFVIKNYMEKRMIYGEVQMDQGLSEIGKCLKKQFPLQKWFYLRDGHFVVICKDKQEVEEVRNFLRTRFSFIWKSEAAKLYLNIAMVELSPEISIKTSDNLLDGLRIAFSDAEALLDGMNDG